LQGDTCENALIILQEKMCAKNAFL